MDGAPTETPVEEVKPTWTTRLQRVVRRPVFLYAIGPAVLLVIGVIYFALNAGFVSTDDATVSAARVAISPEIRGRIVEIKVHDNQFVHQGDILVRLDEVDYQIELATAQAQVSSAKLQVQAARAQYSFAISEYARQRRLFAAGVASRHDVEEAQSAANVAAHQAGVSANGRLGRIEDHPSVRAAQAALDQANSNVGDAVLRAPRDGVVTRVDQIQIGAYTQPGQALFWLISGAPWVDAAFKEDQLESLRPGQPAQIHIDAYPHTIFRGHVASLSPGTGASFSVLPTQNATGNWVKVVQRLNVRVALDNPPADRPLAIGLSANVRIDTRGREPTQLRGLAQ